MPTIHRIGNIRLAMFSNDHEPAHVHLEGPGWRLKVELGTWEVIVLKGQPRGYHDAIEWARANEARLWTLWQETRAR